MVEMSADLKHVLLDVEVGLIFALLLKDLAVASHPLVGPRQFLDADGHLMSAFVVVEFQFAQSLAYFVFVEFFEIV